MAQVTTITAGQLGTFHHSSKRTHNPKSHSNKVDFSVKRGRDTNNKTGNFFSNHYNLGPRSNRRVLNSNEGNNSIRMKAKSFPSSYDLNPSNINFGNDSTREYNNNGNIYRKGKYLIREAQNHYRQGGSRNQYMYWESDFRIRTTGDLASNGLPFFISD